MLAESNGSERKKQEIDKQVEVLSDPKARLFQAIETGDNDRVYLILKKAEENEQTIFSENSVGALVEATIADGATPLFVACKVGNVEAVRTLLKAGAISTRETKTNGFTPLWIAAQKGKPQCLEVMLQQRNAPINKVARDGRSPLYVASESGNIECVRLLIEAKANVDRRRNDRCTPLIVAAVFGNAYVVEMLIAAGARLKLRDEDGTALDNARRTQGGSGEREKCIALLEEAMARRGKDEIDDGEDEVTLD